MPDTNAGQLTDNLLRRLRDPNAVGLSRTFVRSLLSDCQRLVNGAYRLKLTTTTLTTNPNQLFYPISAIASDILRIERVREGSRDLGKVPFGTLGHISTFWFRDVDSRFKHFVLLGRDMLIVYPAKSVESSVTIVYTKLTNEFTDDSIEIEIHDDDMLEASDLAQAIMLTKMRKYEMLAPIIEQFTLRNSALNEQK